MLTAYLTTLIIGASMLLLSIFGGGEHELDSDLQLDAGDMELDVDADAHGSDLALLGGYGFDGWLPVGSLRFWTFFFADFGLVGTALTLLGGLGMALTLGLSIGTGYLSGVTATRVLKALSRESVGKVIGGPELIGICGILVLPVAPGQPGKIRLELGSRVLEEIAYSDDERLAAGTGVLILSLHEDGGVWVAPTPLLERS